MENINWEYVISILGLIITVLGLIYIKTPKLKYFVEILPFVSPSNVDKNIKNKLKITYNDQEVKQLDLARITIYNKGKAVAENFSSPIAIKFNNKILYALPNEKNLTSGIINEYTIAKDNTKIEFMPKFINQGENLSFDIVLERIKDINIIVTGRCKGCSNIKEIKSKNISYKIVIFLGIITGFSIAYCFNYYKFKHMNELLITQKNKLSENYQKFYNLIEKDEKNMKQIKQEIKTPLDIAEAYADCENSLNFYRDIVKENISENLKNIENATTNSK